MWDVVGRPKAAAVGNNAGKGGGYEYTGNYKGCTVEFLGMENIHELRKRLL